MAFVTAPTLLSVLPTNVFATGANVDGDGNVANESGAFSQSNYSWRIYLMCSLRGGQAVEQLGVTRDIVFNEPGDFSYEALGAAGMTSRATRSVHASNASKKRKTAGAALADKMPPPVSGWATNNDEVKSWGVTKGDSGYGQALEVAIMACFDRGSKSKNTEEFKRQYGNIRKEDKDARIFVVVESILYYPFWSEYYGLAAPRNEGSKDLGYFYGNGVSQYHFAIRNAEALGAGAKKRDKDPAEVGQYGGWHGVISNIIGLFTIFTPEAANDIFIRPPALTYPGNHLSNRFGGETEHTDEILTSRGVGLAGYGAGIFTHEELIPEAIPKDPEGGVPTRTINNPKNKDNPSGSVTVVKVYENQDGEHIETLMDSGLVNTIDVRDEGEFEVQEWKIVRGTPTGAIKPGAHPTGTPWRTQIEKLVMV